MTDFTLYYWPVPFRGQFVRAILAHAGRTWSETNEAAISALMQEPPGEMPVPFMGPPVLVDHVSGAAISQMPAILLYLGETLELLPSTPELRALTMKVVNDANYVIDEITLDGGRQMWTEARWSGFAPRLEKWMALWEDLGRRHGLTAHSGFLLGGERPGVADIVTATLWSALTERFRPIEVMLEETAPMTGGLAWRLSRTPALARLAEWSRREYGDAYCGGDIEQSLRRVLNV
ncbi:glutathione S-transferase [Brevundimonas diminuta]|uniref:glutathione S-transferase n=1 Tax=Brevundimonas diminuta TaxID=293 RepID=UPI00320A2379